MIITGKEDLRIQKTVTVIRQTFVSMLLAKNYDKITVTALCQNAKINKKTFYNYYEDLNALLNEFLEEFSKGYLDRIKNYRVPEDLEEINREFFIYSTQQGALYEKIVCSAAHHHIGNRFIGKIVKATWHNSELFQRLKPYEQKILLTFVYNVGLELYRQWVNDGKIIPLEEMIKLSGELLSRGTEGYTAILKNFGK